MFRHLRILALLLILATVAQSAWLARSRTTSWISPINVVIYPVNGDGSDVSGRYIAAIDRATFAAIEVFFAREAARYGVAVKTPVEVRLAPAVARLPPPPPAERSGLPVVFWSLQLRFWAWRNDRFDGPRPDIRMFVLYHDPARSPRLAHSLGLQQGQLGVVNAFASLEMAESNNVVIAHEVMHTVGATDKYAGPDSQPLHPPGYAEPERQPRYPQRAAEIMGGRIPLSPGRAAIPASLDDVVVGPFTAVEIRWTR